MVCYLISARPNASREPPSPVYVNSGNLKSVDASPIEPHSSIYLSRVSSKEQLLCHSDSVMLVINCVMAMQFLL